jgi:hypothetical protein
MFHGTKILIQIRCNVMACSANIRQLGPFGAGDCRAPPLCAAALIISTKDIFSLAMLQKMRRD